MTSLHDGTIPTRLRPPVVPHNEGEADNPGPEGRIVIGSANVTSLRRRWPIACRWNFDVLAVQETKLGEEAQIALAAQIREDEWEPVWGAPQPLLNKIREGNIAGINVNDAKHGGVGVLVKGGQPVQKVEPRLGSEHLFDEGRLVHAYLPWGDGSSGMYALSMYGYATADNQEERRELNSRLYRGALSYADRMGKVPCVICADCNPNPAEADLVSETLAGSRWTDLFSEWYGGPDAAPVTYSREGPVEGLRGRGATRPDRIILNREALALVMEVGVHYELDNGQHAVLSATFDRSLYEAKYRMQKEPKPFDC